MKIALLLEETKKEMIIRALKKCKPFLLQYRDDIANEVFLLRGMNTKNTVSIINTQENRKPRDSYQEFHDTVDDLLNRHLGHKFRSNHVCFCVSSQLTNKKAMNAIEEYGNAHFVFPIGANYKFCYSTVINDFYANYDFGVIGDLISTNSDLREYCVSYITKTLQTILKQNKLKNDLIDDKKIESTVELLGDEMFRHYCGAYSSHDEIIEMYAKLIPAEHINDGILNMIKEFCSTQYLKSFVDGMFKYLKYSTQLDSLSDANIITPKQYGASGQIEVVLNCETYVAIKCSKENKELIHAALEEVLKNET